MSQACWNEKGGGGGGCIYSQVSRSIMLHGTWHSYLPAVLFSRLSSFGPKVYTVFYLSIRGSFWGSFGVQNGSCVVLLEILRSLLFNDIKFVQIRAWSEKLWLLEARVSEQFFCVFSTKILAKPEMLPANRELHIIAEVALFIKVSNLWINSQWVGKTLCAKMVPREKKCIRFPTRFSYFRRFSRARLMLFLMLVFDDLAVSRNHAKSSSKCHKSREKSSLGLWDMIPRTKAVGEFFHDERSLSDWDFGLTGGDLGNPRVARHS